MMDDREGLELSDEVEVEEEQFEEEAPEEPEVSPEPELEDELPDGEEPPEPEVEASKSPRDRERRIKKLLSERNKTRAEADELRQLLVRQREETERLKEELGRQQISILDEQERTLQERLKEVEEAQNRAWDEGDSQKLTKLVGEATRIHTLLTLHQHRPRQQEQPPPSPRQPQAADIPRPARDWMLRYRVADWTDKERGALAIVEAQVMDDGYVFGTEAYVKEVEARARPFLPQRLGGKATVQKKVSSPVSAPTRDAPVRRNKVQLTRDDYKTYSDVWGLDLNDEATKKALVRERANGGNDAPGHARRRF